MEKPLENKTMRTSDEVIGVIGSASPVIPASSILALILFLTPRLIAFWFIVLGVQLYRYGLRLHARVASRMGAS